MDSSIQGKASGWGTKELLGQGGCEGCVEGEMGSGFEWSVWEMGSGIRQ